MGCGTGTHVLSGTHTLPHSKTRLYCVYYFCFLHTYLYQMDMYNINKQDLFS